MTPVVAALVTAAVVGAGVWFAMRQAPPSVVRMTITTSGSAALLLHGQSRDVAITPDGSRVVYRGNNQLLVRALDQLEPTVLSGLGAPQGVFISPDGQWIGFFDGASVLKKVGITGGPPVIMTAVDGGGPRGATWGPDGTVVYATNAPATGLQSISAAGGESTVLTKPDREEGDHYWPEFLPGGQAVLFTITSNNGSIDNAMIAVWDGRTNTSKVLIRGGSHAHYVPTGHLVYGVAGTLRAVAFDLGRLEVVGTPVPVLEGVVTTGSGAADVVVSANGSLVYVPGGAGESASAQRTIVSVDREGRASPLPGLPRDSYRDVRVSPNGAALALATQSDVWTYALLRATLSRLTTDRARDASPLWTPDGQRIVFTSSRSGDRALFWRPADGSGTDEPVLRPRGGLLDLLADSWSPDGRQLVFSEVSGGDQCGIGQVAIDRPSDVNMLINGASCNFQAAVSPNGRWIAYRSRRSGRDEVYIEGYPELGSRHQISADGGSIPVWSRDSQELFFASSDGRQMFAVPIQSGSELVAGRAKVLFEFPMLPTVAGGARPYDVAPDGRFFIIRSGDPDAPSGGSASNLIVVQNWTEELKRLVPVN